jgi:hypothetical protein
MERLDHPATSREVIIMACPPELAEIISEILQNGFLRIRALGNNGDAERCAAEADHLHNLPVLISRYSPELLRFYWDVERVAFLKRIPPNGVTSFESLWMKLERFMAKEMIGTAA